MLENYPINKIILSREITLREIETLVTRFPQTRFEVFGEGDFCRYNNGLCFAEHKYGAKDICTVVVNDLIIKKTFRPDFKKIILDEHLSVAQKLEKLDDTYMSPFEEIEYIFERILLGEISESEAREKLLKILKLQRKRIDLFFDAQKPISDIHNKNILTFLKALKFVQDSDFSELQVEIENSVKTGMQYLSESMKQK